MGDLTRDRSILLDKLVGDCITYGLSVDESLEYIKRNFGEIKERVLFRRKKKIKSEESLMGWTNHLTRIGFLEIHRRIMEDLEREYNDTMHQLHLEETKSPRDEYLIVKMKTLHLKQAWHLSENSLGVPILAALKAKLDKYQDKDGNNLGIDYYYKHHTSFFGN